MSEKARVESDLVEAQAAVSAARTLLDQGRVVDLTGLEHRVQEMCDIIAGLDPSDRADLKAPLVSLIDDLTGLAKSLFDQHATMSGQLQGVSDRARAFAAYGEAVGQTDGAVPGASGDDAEPASTNEPAPKKK